MNKQRRKDIAKAIELLEQAKSILEESAQEEQDCFDNMPEGLQCSDNGQKIEENATALQDMVDSIQEVIDNSDEVLNQII